MTDKEVFEVLAKELCRRVNAEYPPPEGTIIKPTDYSWTETEECDFKEWMKKYLFTAPMFKQRGKQYIAKEADWFIFQYGWKTRREGEL